MFVCIVFFLSFFGSSAEAQIESVRTLTLCSDGYSTLSQVWNGDRQIQRMTTFATYWKDASRLSGVAFSDSAWRHLRCGTAIVVPAIPTAVAVVGGTILPEVVAVVPHMATNGIMIGVPIFDGKPVMIAQISEREKALTDLALLQRKVSTELAITKEDLVHLYGMLFALIIISILALIGFFRRGGTIERLREDMSYERAAIGRAALYVRNTRALMTVFQF